ncbi:anti-sigma B factor antagonist [Erwinia sp. OLTSP20]|uniref:lipid asymmetry maintenance protein MlaB n=1 Tax=unclassified Erwinia TaxID=2622719 RepID=UPI000C1A46A1|nr:MULTISPECIES: lipid asymmetry maintenance protein MlaB [unclassified Erwinia]PIJ51040.1 anti-sigma B factor antagonist [Erwinia sp. OAMSP11]PIJ73692.1 anti-sigma B factor antagonist [Erwinia sp. OLSSP12]PIJ83049.1 anti-sigma B factor antagonist [Erwinia sp. OLCASP19]PIJ85648.1 anti-sigma B factor antagonist [Erwinia sp. OLMTSP26]PIJ87703.1 anti-sigma B factor antagonist [Erwinia sp. OLMDSP33]
MNPSLSWTSAQGKLALSGWLTHETLLPLWQQREDLMNGVSLLDVSGLEQVDTAGLALLIHLRETAKKQPLTLQMSGITDRLRALIGLYNLQSVMITV